MKFKLSALILYLIIAPQVCGIMDVKVLNTNDNGAGSLRAAIEEINGEDANGQNIIRFMIPDTDPGFQPLTNSWRITPLTDLPEIVRNVLIDGCTQPGAEPNTNPITAANNAELKIEIRGPGPSDGVAPAPTNGLRLGVSSDGSIIRGLCINSFAKPDGSGIRIDSNITTIEGCFIGSDITGMFSFPNFCAIAHFGNSGVVGGSSPAVRNLLAGNFGSNETNGVIKHLMGSIVIRGNTIGIDKTGTARLGQNSTVGVSITGMLTSTTIDNNVIAGHSSANVFINSSDLFLTLSNNKIGTDVSGMQKIEGNGIGIVANTPPPQFLDLLGMNIFQNLVSGNTYGVTANTLAGPVTVGRDVVLLDNIIGLNANRTDKIPNTLDGVWLQNTLNTVIQENNIAGNDRNGLRTTSAQGAIIKNNTIGGRPGQPIFPNGCNGLQLGSMTGVGPTTRNIVVDNNTIANNLKNGVALFSFTKDVYMRTNDILENSKNGIFVGPHTQNIQIGGFESEGDLCLAGTEFQIFTEDGNIIQSNGKYGIKLLRACNTTIQLNTIEENMVGGIAVEKSNNTLIGSKACAPNPLLGNKINRNKGFGIRVDKCSKNTTVLSNSFENNDKEAIKRNKNSE